MILGPNDPRAVQRKRLYWIKFRGEDGEVATIEKYTVWAEIVALKKWLRAHRAELLDWGYDDSAPSVGEEGEEIIEDFFAFMAATRGPDDEL